MKIVFATHNQGKVEEMRAILKNSPFEVLSAEDAGLFEDVTEDGETFAQNALKKARFAAQKLGTWAVADDSGICIDALGGAPGVYSARWAGEDASGQDIVCKTISEMEKVAAENRGAHFESALALVSPQGKEWFFTGIVKGYIPTEPRGKMNPRLPYDVVFVPEGFFQTFAEMSGMQKNLLSHRGKAFAELKEFLLSYEK